MQDVTSLYDKIMNNYLNQSSFSDILKDNVSLAGHLHFMQNNPRLNWINTFLYLKTHKIVDTCYLRNDEEWTEWLNRNCLQKTKGRGYTFQKADKNFLYRPVCLIVDNEDFRWSLSDRNLYMIDCIENVKMTDFIDTQYSLSPLYNSLDVLKGGSGEFQAFYERYQRNDNYLDLVVREYVESRISDTAIYDQYKDFVEECLLYCVDEVWSPDEEHRLDCKYPEIENGNMTAMGMYVLLYKLIKGLPQFIDSRIEEAVKQTEELEEESRRLYQIKRRKDKLTLRESIDRAKKLNAEHKAAKQNAAVEEAAPIEMPIAETPLPPEIEQYDDEEGDDTLEVWEPDDDDDEEE